MKQLFSILFAVMIVLSGMHLSVATHLCGGEIADVKISFTNEKAGCGMCIDEQNSASQTSVDSESCCKDQVSFYAVDSNYEFSSTHLNKSASKLLLVFDIPQRIGNMFFENKQCANINVKPPGEFIPDAVELSDICVFII